MEYSSEADYKYVSSMDSVPVGGQDIGRSWDENDVHRAVQEGEEKMEGDVNDGAEIKESNRQPMHGIAAATWATYRLVLSMKSPDATTRGDVNDEGSERMQIAEQLRADYEEWIRTIKDSQKDQSEETSKVRFDVANWQ